jgi:large subunit ribosomal protein L10
MPRPEKVQAVADIKERLESASAVFVAEYSGLSVKAQQELRRGLRASDGEFKVVKMTLARRAAEELGHEDLMALLIGPTGLAFAHGDAAATAKALRDFAADHASLVIKGALLSGELLAPERIAQLADLEPRDVLLAKIAGAFSAPMSRMAGLLAALPRGLATALQQLVDKTPAQPTPVAEDAAPEAEAAAAVAEEPAPVEGAGEEESAAAEEAPAAEAAGTDETSDDDDAGTEPDGDPDDAAVEAEEE